MAVVGIDYPNADEAQTDRRFELARCALGEPVELRPEPDNLHDEYAVAVFSQRGVQVGYVTAERAPLIGGKLRAGEPYVALFQGMMETAGVIRVRFGGDAPTLPPPPPPATGRPRPVAGEDFYPDPEGPEWGA